MDMGSSRLALEGAGHEARSLEAVEIAELQALLLSLPPRTRPLSIITLCRPQKLSLADGGPKRDEAENTEAFPIQL